MGPGLLLIDSRIPRADGVVFLDGENMLGGGDEGPPLGAVDGLVVDLRRKAASSMGGEGVLVIIKAVIREISDRLLGINKKWRTC